MKLSVLMNATDKLRKLNARFVKVIQFKKGYNKKGQATAIARTYTSLKYGVDHKIHKDPDQSRYVSSITFLDKQLNVKVSCSCPDFMYRQEWILNQHGAADIKYGNGEPPLMTRQDDKPSICKHVIALRLLIKQQEGV